MMCSTCLRWFGTVCLGVVCVCFVGCQKAEKTGTQAPVVTAEVHDHPSEGPHDGALIELGDEEYHAELLHDEAAGTVAIYVLDSTAQVLVPIDATQLLINLSHDGQAEQFTLQANPEPNDPAGLSSLFTSDDAELAEDLDLEDAKATLVIVIAGKQYRGVIEHDHEGHEGHEGHEAGHDEEHGDEHGDEEHGDEEHGDEEHGDEEHGDEEHGDEEHGDEEHGDEEHGDEEHGDEELDDEAEDDNAEVDEEGADIEEDDKESDS